MIIRKKIMSDIHITINGGNNQIMPNATHAEQHFHYHGAETPPAAKQDTTSSASDEDRQRLSIYINKVENLDKYISLLSTCKTASEVGEIVATMCENEPNLDSDRIAKESFIRLLLPLIPNVEKGKGIDNLRIQIDKAWTARKKALRNQK